MNWICQHCAAERGSHIPEGHLATWHIGTCDVCRQQVVVTQPRDFRPRPDATQRPALGTVKVHRDNILSAVPKA